MTLARRSVLTAGLAAALALGSGPALAGKSFEGILELKLTSKMSGGKITVQVGKGGTRSEVDVQSGGMPMKMVMLVQSSNPDLAYALDEAHRTYGEVDLKAGRALAQRRAEGVKYTARKLGTAKIAGWSCVHAELLRDGKREVEIWTSRDIADLREMSKMMGPSSQTDEGMMKALEGIGAAGFVVKLVRSSEAHPDEQLTMELVRAERRALPASTFELPAGYAKREAGLGGGGMGLPPELEQQLKKKLDALPPEQQEMMRRAMQKQGAGR